MRSETEATALSRVCFGCEQLGGTDWGDVDVNDVEAAVERALEIGIDFFDTAAVYGLGLSEERLAGILGPRRHDVVIATKGGMVWDDGAFGGRAKISKDSSPRQLRRAAEASLRRLKLECIPIYYIHWPDPDTEIRRTFEFLTELRNEGKIGRIGCSNFNAAQVRAASEVSTVSLVQLPMNLLGDNLDAEMDEVLVKEGIDLVVYNVLANGLLTGKFDEHSRFRDNDRRSRLPLFQGEAYRQALRRVSEISESASEQGRTTAQHAIAEVLRHPRVASVVVGIKSRAQLEENCAVLSRSSQQEVE